MEDWTGIRDYNDSDLAVESMIAHATGLDEPEIVNSLMKSPIVRRCYTLSDTVIKIVESICLFDAVNCATALLEGKLFEGMLDPIVSVNMPIVERGCLLHYAVMSASPVLVQFCLSRGARTNIILDDRMYRPAHAGLIPLEIALDMSRRYCSEGNLFLPGQSTFQSLVSFFLHLEEDVLEVCKLLSLASKNVGKDAYCYAMEGKLIEFVVLLLVARKKVLALFTYSRRDGDGWNGITTLRQSLRNEIGSLFGEELNLAGSLAKNKLTWIHRKKMVLRSAAVLLDVFERAGDAIEEYKHLKLRSVKNGFEVRREQVENELSLMLLDAGFRLKARDFDFSISDWMNSHGSGRTPINYLKTPTGEWSESLHPRFPLFQQKNFRPRNKIIPSSMRNSINMNCYPKSMFVSPYSTCLDVQVKKQTKTIEHGLVKYLSMDKCARISMLIKRWIRNA